MHILALDLGAIVGVCHGDAGERPTFSSWTLGSGPAGERGMSLARCIASHIGFKRPDVIYVEAPQQLAGMLGRGTNMGSLTALYGYDMVAHTTAAMKGIPSKSLDTQQCRKHLLGVRPPKGKGKEMVNDRCKLLGWSPANLDESDAGAVWYLATALEAPNAWMQAAQDHAARMSK